MENGGCEHQCIDTDGDSYCECREGYELVEGFECEGEFTTYHMTWTTDLQDYLNIKLSWYTIAKICYL